MLGTYKPHHFYIQKAARNLPDVGSQLRGDRHQPASIGVERKSARLRKNSPVGSHTH